MFDFDGPVCSVFAGLPAPGVAQRLRDLAQASVTLPDELARTEDPFMFFQATPALPATLASKVRDQLRSEELAAVESAEPTPGAHRAIAECHRLGKVVTVVSNNAAEAVSAYLSKHGLSDYVMSVSARRSPDPKLMKPAPHLVVAALNATGVAPNRSVLIGDSVTDIEAAHAARTAAIGYANKPGKNARFVTAGADVIVTDMAEVARSVA